jgi:tetratricopeptide (TPR) repeat protein
MENKQIFEKKIIDVVFMILFIKVIYSLISGFYLGSNDFVILMLTTIVISLVLYKVLKRLSDSEESVNRSNNGSGSNVLLQSSVFERIEQKYRDLAKDYINKKEYKKAAHVYMKLLKNNYEAANVLYDGGLYIEAATINLKYLKNETKAAECFEKGKAYKDALDLYLKLNNQEKVGDMYMNMNDVEEAKKAYYKETDSSIACGQYIKASQLLRSKIKAPKEAQELLLEGWDKNIQRNECLIAYFQNLSSDKLLDAEIQTIYETKTNTTNNENFIQVIKNQFGKNDTINKKIRTITYEVVAQLMDKKPEIVSELNYLNTQNTTFTKDVMKYKMNRRGKV